MFRINFPLLLVIFLLQTSCFLGQNNPIEVLEKKVVQNNDNLQYEKSIQLIDDFIAANKKNSFEKYKAFVFKSHTYKRLFNYQEALHNLNLAENEGLKSDAKVEVINNIKAEKSFIYFDTSEFEKASKLIAELVNSNYEKLTTSNKSFVMLQEGYFLTKNKKYAEALQKFNECEVLLRKFSPRDLPIIYGKKMELYNAMKLPEERDLALKEGLKIADQFKILKYKLYLYEIAKKEYQVNKDYKYAFDAQTKYDSLSFIYNATNNNGKIQILEQKIEQKHKQIEADYNRNFRIILFCLIFVLMVLCIISFILYKSNKQKRILVEKENNRIFLEIERLTKTLENNGTGKLELSNFDLTERQVEIIDLIKLGKTNKEIASILFISENTVKYHLKIIYEILDIENRKALK